MDKVDQMLNSEARKIKSKIFQKEREIDKLKIFLSDLEGRINKN